MRIVTNMGTANRTTHFVHDLAGNVIAETDGTGAANTVREYIWVPGIGYAGVSLPVANVDGINTASPSLYYVDLFFLHSNIIPDDYDASAYSDRPATRWKTYAEEFVPACERLVADGRIGAWAITGIGIPDCILAAIQNEKRPAAVQCISNPLDSAGELKYFDGPSRAREIIAASKAAGAGVLGIRPVQGGALTDSVDRDLPENHGVSLDYKHTAKFRAVARELGMSSAALAHRYTLSMEGVDTVVLGCKNRGELLECIAAANAGVLDASIVQKIEAACR